MVTFSIGNRSVRYPSSCSKLTPLQNTNKIFGELILKWCPPTVLARFYTKPQTKWSFEVVYDGKICPGGKKSCKKAPDKNAVVTYTDGKKHSRTRKPDQLAMLLKVICSGADCFCRSIVVVIRIHFLFLQAFLVVSVTVSTVRFQCKRSTNRLNGLHFLWQIEWNRDLDDSTGTSLDRTPMVLRTRICVVFEEKAAECGLICTVKSRRPLTLVAVAVICAGTNFVLCRII